MTYPKTSAADLAAIPARTRDLGPQPAHLFAPMHWTAALRCLRAGALLTTREFVSRPDHRILGDPDKVRERISAPLPDPWLGKVADAVPLSFTPRTAASLGSCGLQLAPGAERFVPTDLVVVVTTIEVLVAGQIPHLFSDRNPMRTGAYLSETAALDRVPWERIRRSQFGRDVEPDERARYGAEVLVWGGLPLAAGVAVAVAVAVFNEAAAEAFAEKFFDVSFEPPVILVRPDFFFGR